MSNIPAPTHVTPSESDQNLCHPQETKEPPCLNDRVHDKDSDLTKLFSAAEYKSRFLRYLNQTSIVSFSRRFAEVLFRKAFLSLDLRYNDH